MRMHYDGEIKESEFISIQNQGLETRLYPLYPKDQSVSIGEGLRDGEMLSQRGMRDPDRVNRQFGSLPVGQFLSLTSKMYGKRAKLIEAIRRPLTPAGVKNEDSFAPTSHELDDEIELLIPSADGTTERILVNTRADGSFMHKNSCKLSVHFEPMPLSSTKKKQRRKIARCRYDQWKQASHR